MDRSYEQPLQHALEHALRWLDNLDDAPVNAVSTIADLRRTLGQPLADAGMAPSQVIDQLVAATEPGLTATGSGRFHGWVIGGALPAALAADWMTAAWDQNAGALAAAPAAAVIEEVAGTWLKELLNIPAQASFTFCTGSQTGHVIALAAARHAVLDAVGWDVEQRGLAGSPPIRILTTALRHITVDRAVRYLGLGLDSIVPIPTDETFSIAPAGLRAALAAGTGPTILVLQAGDLCTGAYDRFDELIDIAHAAGAWVHIDGAFGLWAAASPTYRHLMRGAEKADSWVTDGHKWLNVPYDSGYCFVANPHAHMSALAYTTSYLPNLSEARDLKDWNIEMSRRARGFSTWAALRQLGRDGVTALVDQCCRAAELLTLGIGDLNGAEVVWPPIINQGLVRFLDPNPAATDADHDRQTDAVIANVLASGEALFAGVTWHGRRAMRVSVSNYRTTEADIARDLAAIESAIAQVNTQAKVPTPA